MMIFCNIGNCPNHRAHTHLLTLTAGPGPWRTQKTQRPSPRCEIRVKVRKNRAGGAGSDSVSQECRRSPEEVSRHTCTDLLRVHDDI